MITTTKRSWVILLLYALLASTNFIMWLTYSTLWQETMEVFGLTIDQTWMIGSLGTAVGGGYLIAACPASIVLSRRHGLRQGILCSSACNLLGAVLRYLSSHFRVYGLAVCGQVLVGIAQPFFMAAAAQLSTEWFGPSERALATSLAILAQVVGQALVFILGPAVGFEVSMLGQLAACAVLLPLTYSLFVSSAPVAGVGTPTRCTAVCRYPLPSVDVVAAAARPLCRACQDPAFVLFALGTGCGIGLFWSLTLVLVELLGPLGYSESQAGVQ